jgi:tetratricopeptide (TPR) repeat protein
LHRFPEALAQYRSAFTLRPQWSRSSNNIVAEYGETMISAGRPASAESLFHVQLEGDAAARARAHRSLGLLNIYRGQSAAARDLLRQAITEDVGSSSATSLLRDRMYLIRALFDVGKIDSARAMLQAAVEFSRKQSLDPEWFGTLGELAARLGNRGVAKEMESRVLAAFQADNNDDAVALRSLQGEIALLDGNGAAAREHFEAALAATRWAGPIAGAARSAVAQDRRKEAETLFAEVVSKGVSMTEALPAFFEAHLELGRLAAARGDTTTARQHLGWIMTQWATADSDLVVRRAAAKALASLDAGRGRR